MIALKKADGSHAWLRGARIAVRDSAHRLVAIEGILTDITDRRLAEEKMRRRRVRLAHGLPSRAAFSNGSIWNSRAPTRR